MPWTARDRFAHALYDRIASSERAVRLAVRARLVAGEVISHHLAPGIDPEANGEAWLARAWGPHVSRFADVGANVGAWTAMLLGVAPGARGLLFEPSAQAAARLRERLGADERVRIVESAVGDVPGTLTLYEEPDAGETTSLVAGHSGADAVTRQVPVVTLDDELGDERLDLLKIDTEGYDLHVLRGARRALTDGRIAVVQFEYNRPWARAGSTLAAAYALLEGCGYQVLALRHDGLHHIRYEGLGDFFSYANFVALGPGAEGLSTTRRP